MCRKGYIVGSIILFLVAAGLVVAGVMMFNIVPLDVVELTARQSLIVVGMVFAFIFAVVSFGLAVGFLIAGINNHRSWWY